jgi:hypothetical protein
MSAFDRLHDRIEGLEGYAKRAEAEAERTEARLAEALAALKRIAAGPNSEPFAEPWSIAEAKIALARITRIQPGEETR